MDDKCVVDKNNNTNDVELLGWLVITGSPDQFKTLLSVVCYKPG